MFKQMNVSNTGYLSSSEFYNIYDSVMLKWEPQYSNIPWYHSTWIPLQNLCQLAHNMVTKRYFEHAISQYHSCVDLFFNEIQICYLLS